MAKKISTPSVPRGQSPTRGSAPPTTTKEWETSTSAAAARRRTSKLLSRSRARSARVTRVIASFEGTNGGAGNLQ